MSIYASAVKKPVTTSLIFITVIILGLFSYQRLSIDLLPEIEVNTILVMTAYPGASANDIETNVTRPLENSLNGINDLRHITSISRENISLITLQFEHGVNIDVATNDVRDKINVTQSFLPDDAGTPVLFKFGADDIPILTLSVTADKSTNALYKILDQQVVSPLSRISGVGMVSISGTPQREINVYCDPYKLEAYGMTIEQVSQVITSENRNTPGGSIDLGSNTLSLRVQGEFIDAAEILDLVIGQRNGKTIFVRDVAQVVDGVEERSQESFTNGLRGGMIVIQKQSGANSVDIARQVHQVLPELQRNLPSDVRLGIIADTTENITNTMNSLAQTIAITLVLVIVVVFIFLGRWRATLIIAITIPVSLIGAFIYLLASGNTLNIISLSALSLAIALVVDDAIVILENMTTHLNRGSQPKQAAIFATKEVWLSVVASTLTMLAVFLPLTMISGIAGVLFRQLGWIISIVMIISTVASLSLIPMMGSRLLKAETKRGRLLNIFFTPIEKALDALDRGYGRLLQWAVRHRGVVVVLALAIFGGSMMLVPHLRTEFFPTMDNGRIAVKAQLPIGTRQDITREVAQRISDEFIEKYPEIRVLNYTFGQADDNNTSANLSDNGTYIMDFNIRLTGKNERTRSMTQIADLMREDLRHYTELREYNVSAGGRGMAGDAVVDIEIYGYDLAQTDEVAAELSSRLQELPQTSQITISRNDYIPEIQIDFDREKLALNGLNMSTVSGKLRNRINGSVASFFREDGEEYDIRVRFAPEYRESIENIENMMLFNAAGNGVRIRDLGTVVKRLTPPSIERKNRERVVTVSAVVARGYALSDLIDGSRVVLNNMDIPSELFWEFGGTFEEQQETFAELFTLMALIVILVFVVMASQFESLTDPFVIMFSIPFAFTGVFFGLFITGTPMGVMALIGILILIGIVVKNGIVLIDYTILCRGRGMSVVQAVVTAGKSRLRPVLMTTMTTVLGMIPLAIGRGEGAEMWNSMGMTVAWGLAVSTLITLVLVPVLYCIFAGWKLKFQRRKKVETLSLFDE